MFVVQTEGRAALHNILLQHFANLLLSLSPYKCNAIFCP